MDRLKVKRSDITLFDPVLLEVPEDGSLPFLKGYRCLNCRQLDFPKLSPCPNCWGDRFEMVPLSRKGTLYSYSYIYVGQAGLETPYTIAYIDLPENVRVFARLEGEIGSFECGEVVELTVGLIRRNQDGVPIFSYKFKKAG